jgi:hypothetical protein
VFCRKQLTMRRESGICSLQSRNTSGVQAICCSKVPRYSCDRAGPAAIPQPIDIATLNEIRCTRMSDPSFRIVWGIPHGKPPSLSKMNEAWQGSRRTTKCENYGPSQHICTLTRQPNYGLRSRLADAQGRCEYRSCGFEENRYGDRGCRPDSISGTPARQRFKPDIGRQRIEHDGAGRCSPTPPCRFFSPPRSGAHCLPRRTLKIPARPYRPPGCPRSRRFLSLPEFSPPVPLPRAAAS